TLLVGRSREGASPAAAAGRGHEGDTSGCLSCPLDARQIRAELARLQQQEGLPRMEAIKRLARKLGLGKREIYRLTEG
ncbi:MAG: hypothetical protein ACPL7M_05700, partial [Bryobacteraceae bacterium]